MSVVHACVVACTVHVHTCMWIHSGYMVLSSHLGRLHMNGCSTCTLHVWLHVHVQPVMCVHLPYSQLAVQSCLTRGSSCQGGGRGRGGSTPHIFPLHPSSLPPHTRGSLHTEGEWHLLSHTIIKLHCHYIPSIIYMYMHVQCMYIHVQLHAYIYV